VPFAHLVDTFGLQTLIGKNAMIVPDARPTGIRNLSTITERLLSISGEDSFSIHRKFLDDWVGVLKTRIIVLSNVLPRLPDTSSAIANRFIPIQMTISFLGREDRTLRAKLHAEMRQIFNWALEGYRRLNQRGFFIVPGSAQELMDELEDATAPHRIFVRETLVEDPEGFIAKDQLYGRYRVWCTQNGQLPTSSPVFFRNMRTEFPMMQEHRAHAHIVGSPSDGPKRPHGWKGVRYLDSNDGNIYVVPDPIKDILPR
jgi:putative DNA primase/helicase